MSAYRQVDTKQAGGKRSRWPLEVKRQLVAESLEPGSSVSIVARRHDVNANQLFKWRHELAEPAPGAPALVPVAVMPEPATGRWRRRPRWRRSPRIRLAYKLKQAVDWDSGSNYRRGGDPPR